MPIDRFPAAFANQIGVLLENGNHFLASRDRFPSHHTTLGLIDHSIGQFQVVFEPAPAGTDSESHLTRTTRGWLESWQAARAVRV